MIKPVWWYGVVRYKGDCWIVSRAWAASKNNARELFYEMFDEVASLTQREEAAHTNKDMLNRWEGLLK